MLTRDDLVAVMPRAASAADGVTEALGAAMARFEIDRPARKAAFLAQLAHESGQLSRWAENLSYRWPRLRQIFPKYFRTDAEAQAFDRQPERIANRVYGGRLGNGPEASGDGWRYRGRGPIQLTGKSNYRTCGAALGVDLVAEPELLETPEVGCLAAAWFWADKGLNALADAGDFVTITRRINGGLIGLADRRELWERAKSVFGVAPAMPEVAEAEAVPGAARPASARPPGGGSRPGGGARPAPGRERQPSKPRRSARAANGASRPGPRSVRWPDARPPRARSAGSRPAGAPASHRPASQQGGQAEDAAAPTRRSPPRPRPPETNRSPEARGPEAREPEARRPEAHRRRSSRRPAHRKVRAISTARKRHRPARPARRRGARLRVS